MYPPLLYAFMYSTNIRLVMLIYIHSKYILAKASKREQDTERERERARLHSKITYATINKSMLVFLYDEGNTEARRAIAYIKHILRARVRVCWRSCVFASRRARSGKTLAATEQAARTNFFNVAEINNAPASASRLLPLCDSQATPPTRAERVLFVFISVRVKRIFSHHHTQSVHI